MVTIRRTACNAPEFVITVTVLLSERVEAVTVIVGDGAGPAAAVLDPYPRDFRNGLFKYTSTAGGAKPLREDLLRTLQQGIPGTAMP